MWFGFLSMTQIHRSTGVTAGEVPNRRDVYILSDLQGCKGAIFSAEECMTLRETSATALLPALQLYLSHPNMESMNPLNRIQYICSAPPKHGKLQEEEITMLRLQLQELERISLVKS